MFILFYPDKYAMDGECGTLCKKSFFLYFYMIFYTLGMYTKHNTA